MAPEDVVKLLRQLADSHRRRDARSLSARLREALRRSDVAEIGRLRRELGVVEREMKRQEAA